MGVVLVVAPLVVIAYGIGAWVFCKRVLVQWRVYTRLEEDGPTKAAASYLVGGACASLWPVAWALIRWTSPEQ